MLSACDFERLRADPCGARVPGSGMGGQGEGWERSWAGAGRAGGCSWARDCGWPALPWAKCPWHWWPSLALWPPLPCLAWPVAVPGSPSAPAGDTAHPSWGQGSCVDCRALECFHLLPGHRAPSPAQRERTWAWIWSALGPSLCLWGTWQRTPACPRLWRLSGLLHQSEAQGVEMWKEPGTPPTPLCDRTLGSAEDWGTQQGCAVGTVVDPSQFSEGPSR